MEKPYRYIEHTADLGIEVVGSTFEDLLINIGKAIFETQVTGELKVHREITIETKAESIEDLLVDWCRELLYHFSVHGFIPKEYKLTLDNTALTARLSGDVYDPKRHTTKLEIKNPTYHNLHVKKTNTGYQAAIIFDV